MHTHFEDDEDMLDKGSQQVQMLRPAASASTDLGSAKPGTCVLELAANAKRDRIAAALSDKQCQLYSVSGGQLELVSDCTGHTDLITGMCLHGDAPDLAYSCSEDGTVRCWDFRSGQQAQQFSGRKGTSFSSLTTSDSTLVAGAAGSTYFWDRRSAHQLACFEDTHQEAVSQVLYHPLQTDFFISGSLDGLINVAEFSGGLDEDESFKAALNLDASVGQLGFYGEQQEKLWCISKMESLHLWQWQAACEEEAEGGEGSLADVLDVRERLSQASATSSGSPAALSSIDYLLGCSNTTGELSLAAGSNEGDVATFGIRDPTTAGEDCMFSGCRTLLKDGHSDVVRSILWPTESAPVYLTAGEDGRICIWPVLGADVSGTGAKRGLDAGAPVEAKQHKKKRRKQDGRC